MKNRNPFLSLIILWIVAICVALSFCIYGIVSGNLFLGISQLFFIVWDSIWLGSVICRFNAYRDFIKSSKAFESKLKEFEELMRIKENEPFKEFENNDKS